jgi:hypothetical protein
MTRKTGRSICLDEMVVITYECTTCSSLRGTAKASDTHHKQ